MVWESEKSREEYDKIKMKYPKSEMDIAFDRFMRRTAHSDAKEVRQITKMIRLQLQEDGDEFIVYDLSQTRYDDLNNPYHFMRERLGEYALPSVHKTIVYDNENQQQERVTGIDHVDIAYEVPFTEQNANLLHNNCKDNVAQKMGRTQYLVQKANDIKISVRSYKDWLTGDFETLYKTGRADGKLTVSAGSNKAKRTEDD